jgi:DNA-dependent RNA polymerase auxiliary subunit epsilon
MRSLHKQKGMTAIGWLIVLGLIGFFTLLTLKMSPSYMEYYKIVSSLESLEKESALQSPEDIRRLLNRRFNISYVETINEKDVKITNAGKFFRVTAKYDSRVHLFGNVSVVMAFYKQVQVRRSS